MADTTSRGPRYDKPRGGRKNYRGTAGHTGLRVFGKHRRDGGLGGARRRDNHRPDLESEPLHRPPRGRRSGGRPIHSGDQETSGKPNQLSDLELSAFSGQPSAH